MSQHLEKILAHAERQLTSEGSRRLRERLDLYKKFLKIEEHRLRLKHYSGASGLEIVRDRAALLESRFLAGNQRLHSKFRRDFFERCVRGQVESYLKWRLENQDERHRKYGGSVFMQEPNVKNGCGGLRDYHNMQWICYFRDGVMSTAKLVERKYISESDRRAIDRAYDFLLRVRTELHYIKERPADVLTLL